MAHMDRTPPSSLQREINPYVSKLAGRLMETATDAELRFDSRGWELITEVLSYAAAAEQRLMEQRARIEQLEHINLTDDLTGLANRRGMTKFLANALSAAARHRDHGVVGYIDLDGFKLVNDTIGHHKGDKLLRKAAALLKEMVRPTDLVARISGDEFVIILTRCNAGEGMERLHAIQDKINGTKITLGNKVIPLQLSMGCIPFSGNSSMPDLLELADTAMYNNKRSRRT